MAWRYQPVICADHCGSWMSLCEVHFDDNGRLTHWTRPGRTPSGETLESLWSDLAKMQVDALAWVAVDHAAMTVGMTFERAVSQDRRAEIAALIDTTTTHFRRARLSVVPKEEGTA